MENRVISVLLAEDNPDYVKTIRKILSAATAATFKVESVGTLTQAMARVERSPVDTIILDLTLPDSSGMDTFFRIQRVAPSTPIVVLTGSDSEDMAVKLVQSGAEDYIVKGDSDLNLLPRSLLYAIERKQIRNELTRLASFPSLDPGPIIETDAAGKITYLNPAAQMLFPDLTNSVTTHSLLQDWHIAVQKSSDKRGIYVREVKHGDRIYEERIHKISPQGVFRIYVVDITERKEIEKLKEDFIHNVNHELRNPVTVIYGTLRMLLDGAHGQIPEEQMKILQIAQKNTTHLWHMVDDLLEATRLTLGKLAVDLQKISARELIEETVSALQPNAQSKNITLSLKFPADVPNLFADPVRSRQVLTNLVDNAIKFTPPGGKISVQLEIYKDDPNFIKVTVADSGTGVGQHDVTRIFERMYQSKDATRVRQKGLGIGLYLCKELVNRQGGKIWVESSPGKGSRFFFTLPIYSLERILAPLGKNNHLKEGNFVFVTTRLASDRKHALPAQTLQGILKEVRDIVQTSVFSDDLLLPDMAGEGKEGKFFMIARTKLPGAKVIARRIKEKLANLAELKLYSFTPVITCTSLQVPPEKRKPVDTLKFLASKIERMVQREAGKN